MKVGWDPDSAKLDTQTSASRESEEYGEAYSPGDGSVICHAELQSFDSCVTHHQIVRNPGARDTSSVHVLVAETTGNILVNLG